jgi:hypothetical protein
MSENATSKKPAVEGKVVYEPAVELRASAEMSKVEAGVLVGLAAVVVGGLGWLIRVDLKNQEKRAEELRLEREERDRKAEEARKAREAWFNEQRANGMIVVETRDGKYMAIPAEAYAKAQVKKKGEWV